MTRAVHVLIASCLMAVLAPPHISAQRKDSDTIQSIRGKRKPPAKAPKRASKPRPTRRSTPSPRRVSRTAAPRPAPTPPKPAGIIVSRLGGGSFRSIAEALKSAKPGARIILRAGVYDESIVLTQPVEIAAEPGAADGATVIESAKAPCLTMRCEQTVVRGVTLQCARTSGAGPETTIQIERGKLLLENCDITTTGKSCVTVRGAETDPLIRHCRIYNSPANGVKFTDKAHGVLEDCEISGNSGTGVDVHGGSEPQVKNCRIRGAGGDAIHVEDGGKLLVEYSDIYSNQGSGATVGQAGEANFRRTKLRRNNRFGLDIAGGRASINDCDVTQNGTFGIQGSAVITNSRVDTFSGMVAWWPAEENMTDVIGGQSGSVFGKLAYAPAAIGKGFYFDGSQCGIMYPDGDQFRIGGSLSMVAWINLESYPSFSSQILFRGDNRIGLDPYFMNVVPPNEVRITIEQDYTTGETVGFPCPLNQFVHVVGVYDVEKGALRIYKNGRLAASKPTSVRVMKDLDARAEPGLGIGNIQRPAFSNQPFHGIIDEVQLYNRALNDSENRSAL